MSYTYSQALVAEYSRVKCLDTEQSVQLKLNHTHAPFLWHDKTMVLSHRSRFGMTCEILTESLGEALLTWWLADSHAKTLASQGKGQDSTASAAGCGQNFPASLAKYDPSTHSLKTAQRSLLEDLTECSVTLPRWGTMQNGALYQLPTLVRPTKESVYGYLLPTVTASDATSGAILGNPVKYQYYITESGMPRKQKIGSWNGSVGLGRLVQLIPTPTARDSKGRSGAGFLQRRGALNLADIPTIGKKLNPQFGGWMMGWPIGHAELKPLAMGKCPNAQ
jgi:hypothetical protein